MINIMFSCMNRKHEEKIKWVKEYIFMSFDIRESEKKVLVVGRNKKWKKIK